MPCVWLSCREEARWLINGANSLCGSLIVHYRGSGRKVCTQDQDPINSDFHKLCMGKSVERVRRAHRNEVSF